MKQSDTKLVRGSAVSLGCLATCVSVLILSGCSDPSEDVHRSSASERVEASDGVPANAKVYSIAPESTIHFVGSKVTGSHSGGFREFGGNIYVEDGKVVGTSVIEIKMDSTWSDNERLTAHLKSPDFFDVAQFPVARFTVTDVTTSGEGCEVTGNLALHGVEKSVSFPAQVQVLDNQVRIGAEFAINRRDFSINYPGKPNDLIRDNVVIQLEIRADPA